MKEEFSYRLKKAMQIRNMKATELSEKAHIPKSAISQYLSGLYEAKQKSIFKLANVLNVSEAWLMGLDVPMDRSFGRSKIAEINIVNLITNEVIEKIPYAYRTDISDEDPANYFAIYASDNSMAPLLGVGDIAIIKKYTEFLNKKTYLLKIKNGMPIIRKVIKLDDENIELQAMNMWNFPVQTGLTMVDLEFLGEVVRVENKSAFK